MMPPVACSNPSRTAAPFPRGASWRTRRTRGSAAYRETIVPRAVGRVALDDDELDLDVGDVDGQDALDRGRDRLGLVVDRHDDAQSKRPRGRLREE